MSREHKPNYLVKYKPNISSNVAGAETNNKLTVGTITSKLIFNIPPTHH